MDKQILNSSNPIAVRRPIDVEVRPAAVVPRTPIAKPKASASVEVGLTKFIDFILKTGSAKLTVVRESKVQAESRYSPATDPYRVLREGIVEFHRDGKESSFLDTIIDEVTDKVKLKNYPTFIAGYKKFLGKKSYKWFAPPKAEWKHGGLVVRVNPELGLQLGQSRTAVKMYLQTQGDLDKRRAALITHVMQLVHSADHSGITMSVLDVKSGKNYPGRGFDANLSPVLRGEALSFVEMYRSL